MISEKKKIIISSNHSRNTSNEIIYFPISKSIPNFHFGISIEKEKTHTLFFLLKRMLNRSRIIDN
jgi:hypothetical protein